MIRLDLSIDSCVSKFIFCELRRGEYYITSGRSVFLI